MRRRDFIKAITVSAAWPLTARAQQTAMPVVGFLHPGSLAMNRYIVAAFRRQLTQLIIRPAEFDRHVPALDVAGFSEALTTGVRFAVVTASARKLPALMYSIEERLRPISSACGPR